MFPLEYPDSANTSHLISTHIINFRIKRIITSTTYYHQALTTTTTAMNDIPVERPATRVELILSAKKIADKDLLSKSDPICVVYQLSPHSTRHTNARWVEVGRTEQIKNCLNPQWNVKPQLDYRFEEKQPLAFELYDIDSASGVLSEHDFLGRVECELADVVAAPDGSLTLPIVLKGNEDGKDCTLY